MPTQVSSGALNFSASSAAANSDTSRSAAYGSLRLSFSDLLRGQIQSGIDTRSPEIPPLSDTRPAPAPAPVSSSPETSRETARASGEAPAPKPLVSRPSQEPAREPMRANGGNNPTEIGHAVKQPTKTQEDTTPTQQANAKTIKSTESGEKGKTSGNTMPTGQSQLADTAIPPDLLAIASLLTAEDESADTTILPGLPACDAVMLANAAIPPGLSAMIAAQLSEIAGKTAEEASENDFGSQNLLTGHSRNPDTDSSLSARIASFTGSAMQEGTESNADGSSNGGANTNPSPMLMGRPSRHPASTGGIAPTPQAQPVTPAGTEPAARINAATFNVIMTAANAAPMAPHEDGGTRPAGIMPNAGGDISMLNPPRLPTQAGASQFSIPASTGQKAWAEEIGNRVMWMLGRAESRAELILTPPLLGKVEVSIHLNGDQSTAQFLASSQSAREALEQAMPRLRELLAQAGISLGEASVNTSAEGRAQDGENTHRTGMRAPDAHDGNGDATVATAPNWSRLDTGLVNTFA